jgi:tetratricopeptide (TPR) repeat protein
MSKTTFRPLSLVYLLLLLCFSWYISSLFTQCRPSHDSVSTSVEDEYLGDMACATCHQQEHQEWKGSHHDLAMQEASASTVLADFNSTEFESNGVKSRFFRKGEQFFVNTEGPDGKYQNFEVLYTFGADPLQQYMVKLPGGRLQCLLTAWDTKENKWFDLMPEERLNADDWLHWTGGSMTWNTMCADCHSTHLEKNFIEEKDSFATEWAIIDVSCEACHGPGAQHVAYIQSPAYQAGEKISGSLLKLTANLNNKQQVEACGRCHARRGPLTNVFDHSEELMDHYVPEILRTGLYHADGQILDEVYVYGSFLQSKMYHRDVSCTNCHNAHSMKLLYEGNQLCTQCHEPKQYDAPEHHFHKVNTEGADCKSCHMPGKFYMVNDFRRDHSFRVPRPDLSVTYGTPNACNNCHEDQSAEWAAEAVTHWYGPERQPHFSDVLVPAQNGDLQALPGLISMVGDTGKPAIAQATAVWLLGQTGVQEANQKVIEALNNSHPMIRYQAVNAMEYSRPEDKQQYLSPLLRDSIKAIRTQTAYMMADVPEGLFSESQKADLSKATQEYLGVLKIQADFPAGQLQRGQYFHKKRNFAAAEKAYQAALQQDPYLAQAYYNLANLYYQQQRFPQAEKAFGEVVRLLPEAADAYYSLGLLQGELKNLEGAEASLRKAAALSSNPRYYYNWGIILQNLQRPLEAENAYKKALTIYPDSQENLYALAILYLQQNQKAKAQPIVIQLLKLNPNNPDYQNLLRGIQQ